MTTNGAHPPRQSNVPSQTLYVSNLNDKLNKADLRRALYTLFSTHGSVLDVVALKTSKMRGQAHVVFRDSQTSTQALRHLNGYEFFGKEMKVTYGRGKSDIVARLDGTARVREAPKTNLTALDTQKSAFGAAPGTSTLSSSASMQQNKTNGAQNVPDDQAQGVKRRRDEEDEEQESSQEDNDEDAMELSDED